MRLLGSWAATRWEYRALDRALAQDVVCELGGSVTLSISPGTYILATDVAGRGRHSVGGMITVQDASLGLRPLGGEREQRLAFQLTDTTLTLHAADAAWAFDGSGEEPAEFVGILVRL